MSDVVGNEEFRVLVVRDEEEKEVRGRKVKVKDFLRYQVHGDFKL